MREDRFKTAILLTLIALIIAISASIYLLFALSNTQNAISTLEQENIKLKDENSKLSSQLKYLDLENYQLKEMVNELESKVYTLTIEESALKTQLLLAHQNIQELESKLANATKYRIELVMERGDPIEIYDLNWKAKDNNTQILTGKVKNIGNVPIERVYIIAGVYNESKIVYLNWALLTDLYMGETLDFEIWFNIPFTPENTKLRAFTVR